MEAIATSTYCKTIIWKFIYRIGMIIWIVLEEKKEKSLNHWWGRTRYERSSKSKTNRSKCRYKNYSRRSCNLLRGLWHPYVIEGLIGDFNKLFAGLAEKFEHDYNIDIIENTRVVKINPKDKQVYTEVQNSTDDNSKDDNDISKFQSYSNNLPSIMYYKSVLGFSLIFFAASY